MPQFYAWATDFERFKQYAKKHYDKKEYAQIQRMTHWDFCQQRLPELRKHGIPPYRLFAESIWDATGYPYYNIHPQIIGHLARVDLSSVPCEMVELPSRSPAINIRFCEPHDDLILTEDRGNGGNRIPQGSWVHGLLLVDTRQIDFVHLPNHILCIVDFGLEKSHGAEYEHQKQPVYGIYILPMDSKNLDEAFHESINRSDGDSNDGYHQLIFRCLRLAVTVGFLASAPSELVTPDVLAEYRNEYLSRTTSESRKRWIEDKSQRRGKKNGWNVGNDVLFLEGFMPTKSIQSSSTGRELTHAHVRSGHFHAVRHGPKHSKVKIMWFRPTVVRDDLPFEKS